MILGLDDPCHVWKISFDFHLLLILWKDSHLQLAVVVEADVDVGILNSLVHHLENHWSNPMVTTGLIRSEEGLKRKHGWLNGFHAGESYSMGVIFRVRWKCFKLTALTMPPMMLLAGFWFWLFWFRFGLVTWELVGWLVTWDYWDFPIIQMFLRLQSLFCWKPICVFHKTGFVQPTRLYWMV